MTAALTGLRAPGIAVGRRRGGRAARARRLGAPHRAQPRRLGRPAPGWATGSDALFARLVDDVPWHGRAPADVRRGSSTSPGCCSFYGEGEPLPHPLLERGPRRPLSRHYAGELGEPFVTAGLCLYRDGRDSVAWHGDTIGRSSTEDTMVAILSLGAPAPRCCCARAAAATTLRSPARPRRPGGDGRLLPAHLGARHPQDRPAGRPADQRPVPHPRRPVARSRCLGLRQPTGSARPVPTARRRPPRTSGPPSREGSAALGAVDGRDDRLERGGDDRLVSSPTPQSTRSPTAHST